MSALVRLAVTRPKQVLAVWITAISLLGLVGLHLEGHLHQKTDLVVPGTASEREDQLATQRFGKSNTLSVLLEGPRRQLDAQGHRLAAALDRQPALTVLAPWELSDQSPLRPKPDTAILIVRSEKNWQDTTTKVVPKLRSTVDRLTSGPVQAHVAGTPDVANGTRRAVVSAVERAEFLAMPLLLTILLFVFRSPVAASVPLVVGTWTIIGGRGVLELVNRWHPLDAIGLNLMVMMGLALGVDYALLMVSRFREELDSGADPTSAALRSAGTAGRTVVFAGIAVMTAMLAALIVTPGAMLTSSAVGITTAAGISVMAALTALPASLVMLGPRINKWSLKRSGTGDSRFGLLALRALRRPLLASGLVLLLIALLAIPATALDMGPPSARVLPKASVERKDFEAFEKKLGQGWTAPYEVIVASRHGPITDRKTLDSLARFQDSISSRRDVAAVLGPAEIAQKTSGLDAAPSKLNGAKGELSQALDDQKQLQGGLSSAAGGVDDLTQGLSSASAGAQRLSAGGARAAGGAELLASGISRARGGADRMSAGLQSAVAGAKALQAGAGRARSGIGQVHGGLVEARQRERAGAPQVGQLADALDSGGRDLSKLREPTQTADSQLSTGLSALNAMLPTSKADPQYKKLYTAVATAKGAISGRDPTNGKPVQSGYDGLDRALAQASGQAGSGASAVRKLGGQLQDLESGLAALQNGASKVNAGTGRLQAGLGKLVTGLDRLGGGGQDLSGGLSKLESAGQQLASGTRALQGGAGQLSQGLSSGAGKTGQLKSGLGAMEQGVASGQAKTKQLAGGVGSPNALSALTRSGYFSLAAIDQASPSQRRSASFALNLDRGGSAVRFVIIGKGNVTREGHPLRPVLQRDVDRLAHQTGTDARLGGAATRLQDYEQVTKSRLPLLALVLAAVTYLVLVPVLRSVLLPLLALLLTAVTVVAAFGVLVLLFQGSKPLLGGAGYLDAVMVFGIYSLAFALSVDYQVFMLARMREGHALFGDTERAVAYGLRRTAGVVTGAALSMTGVFIAFAVTDVAVMRQLGVGLTVAVLLDATLVRLVLLPAAIRLFGRWSWWMPRWLERLLDAPRPRISVHPGSAPGRSTASAPAAR